MTADRNRRPLTRRPTFWLALFVVWVACGTFVPRNGWDQGLGPVVPHDTFPADCTLCHVGNDWSTIRSDFQFDHEKETGTKLDGAHADVACLLCHNDRGPVQAFAIQGCAGCHEDPHRGELGRNCKDCHGERTWQPEGQILRHGRTRFPLVGAHAAVACFRCHPGAQTGNFAGASTACEHCHQEDFQRAIAPDHRANGWTSDCQRCHRPESWSPAQFAHPSTFPLTLGHGGRRCEECHTTPGTYSGLSTDCASCHMPEYQATRAPNHTAANIATNCASCHTPARWGNAHFPHTSTFPLTNGHNLTCNRCHTTQGVYTGLTTACASCHINLYNATTSPPHASSGFSTNCQSCHNTTGWRGANFVHTSTFPLTNAHNVACTRCHTTPGSYTGLSTDCVSCHRDDYNRATNPTHAGIGMPTTCAQCHGTSAWRPSSFVHRFPRTGAHNRTCTECHRDATNVRNYSCTHCHGQTATAGHHRGVGGYQWVSSQCVRCHPNGRA